MNVNIGGFTIEFWSYNVDLTTPEGIRDLVTNILNFFIYFSVIVAVALIIYSGFLYITSSGEPERLQKATKALTASIVGMVIVLLARLIVFFLLNEFLLQ